MSNESHTSIGTSTSASLSNQFCHFFDDDSFHDTGRPGFRRHVITGDLMQLCFWRIKGGAQGSFMHNHEEHEQLGIVARGSLDFRIGDKETDERVTIGPNQMYLAPQGIWHGDSNFVGDDELDECWILDVFAPPRDDMREG